MTKDHSIECLLNCRDSANVQAIFNAANEAVIYTDATRRVLWCNRAFEMLLGYPLHELRGQTLESLHRHFEDYRDLERHALTGFYTTSGHGFPMTYIHRTGVAVETETTCWTLNNDDGSVAGHVKVLHDRTEANRIERVRRRLFAIVTNQTGGCDDKIEQLLNLACEFLLMPIGIVTHRTDDNLTVSHAKSTLTSIPMGGTFAVADTDCRDTLQAGALFERHDGDASRPHPMLPGMGVRSYIGVPLHMGPGRHGTLAFLNPLPRLSLGQGEREMVTAIADAIGYQLLQDRRMRALERAATEDWLTGAGSNRQFRHDLETIFRTVRRNDSTASLILLDIDHFKSINDSFGHDMGDRVLTEIAALVRESLTPRRTLYRVGGEEFAIILPGTMADNAALMAEQVRITLTKATATWDGMPHVTASFGVASLDPDIDCADAWLKCADLALYASKNNGRNRVTSNGRLSGVDLPESILYLPVKKPAEKSKKAPQGVPT